MMHEIDSVFDHGFVMAMSDDYRNTFHNFAAVDQQKIIFVDFIPTAENLAKHWYEIMREALLRHSIRISHVTVWETPTSTATYKE
jgi:6-pyruvoyl-tetrahydropterin synthase